jgi:hypothetical protein
MCFNIREGAYPPPPPMPPTIKTDTPAFIPNKLASALLLLIGFVVPCAGYAAGWLPFPGFASSAAALLAVYHVFKGDRLATTIISWFYIGVVAIETCSYALDSDHPQSIVFYVLKGAGIATGLLTLALSHAGGTGARGLVSTYGRECHVLPHYWYLWVCTFIGSIGGGIGMYGLFMQTKSLHLSLTQIGQINFATQITVGVLVLGSGWLADRYHPFRVLLVAGVLNLVLLLPANLIWLWWLPDVGTIYVVSMVIALAINAPIQALNGVWDPPLLMRVFPRSRYGQFCATNNLWRTMGGVLGAPIAGNFIDHLSKSVGSDERAYLYIPLWQIAFSIPSLILLYLMFRSWTQYGGDELYVPPIDEPPPDLERLRAEKAQQAPSRRFHPK